MTDQPKNRGDTLLDDLESVLHDAIEAADKEQVAELVEAIPSNEALRQVSMMEAGERDSFISLLEPETAAEIGWIRN